MTKKKLTAQPNSTEVICGWLEIEWLHKDQDRNVYDGLIANYVRAPGASLHQSPSAQNNMGAHPGADWIMRTMAVNGIDWAD